jgi:hypothetical protein
MHDASLCRRHRLSSISALEPTETPKTWRTHSTTLVTDGRRVLLTKEDIDMVWFPVGKHEIKDATP